MGQKVHPIGFRVGVIRDTDSKWYLPKRGFASALHEDYEIRTYVKKRYASAAISKIEIERQGSRVRITLFTAKPGILIGKGGKGIDDLKAQIVKQTKHKENEVHVNIQEIRQPDIDAQLVAESIAQQIERRVAYKRAMRQAILRAMKLGVKGIRVMCAGRLAGSEMARREQDRQGKIPLQTLRADIDYGFATAVTTYSAIGVKVWIYKGDILPGQARQSEAPPQRGEGRPDRSGERGRGDRGGRGGDRGGRGGDRGGRGGGDRGGRGGGGDRPPRADGRGGDRGPRPEGRGDRPPREPRAPQANAEAAPAPAPAPTE
jgi:small subunit ribosomal protein S3